MNIQRVLYATKLRELSYQGLLEIFELKKVGLKEIILLHVIPREDVSFVPFGGYLKEKALKLKESAFLRFQEWAKEISSHGIEPKIRIEIGEPVAKILEISESEKIDLIVIGKKKTIAPWTGEICGKIVSRSKVPVLVYRRMVYFEIEGEIFQRENTNIFNKPLLATDFSEESQRAYSFLLNLKNLYKRVYLIHVINEGTIDTIKEDDLRKHEEEIRKKLANLLRDLTIPDKEGHFFLGLGEPAKEILDFARTKDISLIVFGKTGKGLIQSWLLGSVTKKLLKTSEFPLLIVP